LVLFLRDRESSLLYQKLPENGRFWFQGFTQKMNIRKKEEAENRFLSYFAYCAPQ